MSYDDFTDARIKHLEMIQAVIARLGTNGFVVKGWAITVAGAFLGFAVTQDNWGLAAASAMPTAVFWCLDAYFLRSERLFREFYERVRASPGDIQPFFMGATGPRFAALLNDSQRRATSWCTSMKRPALWLLYGALFVAAVIVLVAVIIAGNDSGSTPRHCHAEAVVARAGCSPRPSGWERGRGPPSARSARCRQMPNAGPRGGEGETQIVPPPDRPM